MLRVLIVDDEEPARNRLRHLLESVQNEGKVKIVGEASDGIQAVKMLNDLSVDLVFLDIRMPGMDGFDVVEDLDPDTRPVVIFTTAYDSYALKAFDASAVDYLLKPFSRKRLEEAINKAIRLKNAPEDLQLAENRLARLLNMLDSTSESAEKSPSRQNDFLRQISIPYRDRILIVPVSQLICAEVQESITRLFVLEEDKVNARQQLHSYVVSYTLDQLETNLDPQSFMRVHRSAIVQLDHIREMIPWFSGRYKLLLTGNHEVIASRERSRLLKEKLML